MKRNILVIIGYPLQAQIDVGHIDVLTEMFENQLELFNEVHIYSPRDSRSYLLGKNIIVHSGGGENLPRSAGFLLDIKNVAGICKKHNISLMRAIAPHTSGSIAFFTSKLTGVPYVCSVHMDRKFVEKIEGVSHNPVTSKTLDAFESWAYKGAASIPYISNFVKEYAISMGAPEERLVYHPNFVDLNYFKPKETWSKTPSKLVFVGRLEKVKGLEYLIGAMPAILKERDATLVVCGDGPQADELKELAKKLGVANKVVFKGRVDHLKELPKILRDSDVFVAPLTGGFTIIEALAVGLPIVAGDNEWITEVVEGGKNGYIVSAKNSNTLSNAILKLLGNPDLLEKMSKNNQDKGRNLFSLEAYKKRELEIYSKALEK